MDDDNTFYEGGGGGEEAAAPDQPIDDIDQEDDDMGAMLKKDGKSHSQKSPQSSTSSSYKGIPYNTALAKTVFLNPKSPPLGTFNRVWIKCCCGCFFQVIILIVYLITANLHDPLLFGLSFLEKEPKHFECKQPDSDEWKPCTKQEICDRGLSKDQYRADTNDDEYFDNWVEKYDLLCEPKMKVGLIGSMYFIGLIVFITFVPPLADYYGRRWVFIITLAVSAVAQAGLMITNDLYWAYFFEFLVGGTFAGRIIVGLNYILEYNLPKFHESIVFGLLISEAMGTITITIWYQFVDRGWFGLQLLCLILAILVTIFFAIVVPESPKWLYTWEHFDESKENLAYVGKSNGMQEERVARIRNLTFDLEQLEKQKSQIMDMGSVDNAMSLKDLQSQISKRRQLISQGRYIANVVILTIQWTVASFSFYLLMFMNKYYEGSIYVNYYLDGLAGITGSLISLPVYAYLKIRWSFIISLSLTLLGAIFLMLFQQGYISPHWVGSLMPEDKRSPYEEDSEDDREYYLSYLIPAVVFITKIGVNFTFQNIYQASFGENLIFPFYKRATAIGICNLVARSVTVSSSLVAELDRPWPAVLLISLTALALIDSFFLPSYSDEEEYEQRIIDIMGKGDPMMDGQDGGGGADDGKEKSE